MLALVLCLLAFQGCTPKNQNDAAERYVNQELGFSVEFPGTWKDKYTVETNPSDESGSSVVVSTTWGGTLCYVFRYTTEEWAESGYGESIPVEYRVSGKSDHYVYLMLFPGDVQYDPGNEEQVDTYNEMRTDLLSSNFEIIGT